MNAYIHRNNTPKLDYFKRRISRHLGYRLRTPNKDSTQSRSVITLVFLPSLLRPGDISGLDNFIP